MGWQRPQAPEIHGFKVRRENGGVAPPPPPEVEFEHKPGEKFFPLDELKGECSLKP